MRLVAVIVFCASAVEVRSDAHADHVLKLSNETVHFGYFSKTLTPKLTISSGQTVVVEMATHHACDDWDKMVKGDAGMESIFYWSDTVRGVQARGATGAEKGGYSGDGVHVLTGPIFVEGAEPGDILQVEIVDLQPRANPEGKTFGSNANAWWGFQRSVNKADGTPFLAGKFTKTPGKNDEVVTIYELKKDTDNSYYAEPSYQFHWPTLTDPDGVTRDFIDIPGTCVPHDFPGASSDVSTMGWNKSAPVQYRMSPYKAKIPVNMHVGCMGLAPASHDFVNSIPPMVNGGNLDDKRIGKGTTMYYPVKVAGGLLSMGDAHMAQGDSELDGTGIETSITGTFKITVHKAANFVPWQTALDFPLGEMTSPPAWVVHGYSSTDYLADYKDSPGGICTAAGDGMRDSPSSPVADGAIKRIDSALTNTFTQTRKFLMAMYNITDSEATTIITQGVDFGLTQLVDCNFGVHAVILKSLFEPSATTAAYDYPAIVAGDKELKLSNETVHFGFFSKKLTPKLTVDSGTTVTVEMATHHACDDWDKMIKGDAGMESIFTWSDTVRGVQARGATGGEKGGYYGDGVHVLTGPIYVNDAEPGDILQVEVVDLQPRKNPQGETYGSNANAWWGYQARAKKPDGSAYNYGTFSKTPGMNDEVITIYKLYTENGQAYATPDYMFEWTNLTDPDGVTRDFIDIPGTCVPHDYAGVSADVAGMGWTKPEPIKYNMSPIKAKIPVNMHVGCMGLAPDAFDFVNSIPPMASGGNLDDKRIGKGTTMYYPVKVAGALLSMGDAHMAQGDSELDGTGIETSITGTFKLTLHKKKHHTAWMTALDFPLGEMADPPSWIVHGFSRTDYLEYFKDNPGMIFSLPTPVGDAMTNAFSQTRKFLMAMYGITEPEAVTIITQGVDFGITQVVDGNFGVHAVIPKSIFSAGSSDKKGAEVTTYVDGKAVVAVPEPEPAPEPEPVPEPEPTPTPAPPPPSTAATNAPTTTAADDVSHAQQSHMGVAALLIMAGGALIAML
jgi:acetamidase/formamidase